MGQPVRVELYMAGEAEAEAALDDIRAHIEDVQARMGFDVEGAELTRLNEAAQDGYYRVQDPDFYRLLRLTLDYAQVTHGAFDPTVGPLMRLYGRAGGRPPAETEIALVLDRVGWDQVAVAPEARAVTFRRFGMELDLGGALKGFALDVAGRAFARSGSRAGLLRLGHNILVWSSPPGQEQWQVALEDPRRSGRPFATLGAANRGIALSAHPEQGRARVLDPRTGRPASSDVLVAVALADSAADADAMATALLVAGSAGGGEILSKTNRVEALLLCAGNGAPYLLASATLLERLQPSAELLEEVEGRVRFILPPQTLELKGPLSLWRP